MSEQFSTPSNSPDLSKSSQSMPIDLTATSSHKSDKYRGVYSVPKEHEGDPGGYLTLVYIDNVQKLLHVRNGPPPEGVTPSDKADLAAELSYITGANLEPDKTGKDDTYDLIPRSRQEIQEVEEYLFEISWYYRKLVPAIEKLDSHRSEDRAQILAQAQQIRNQWNLPERSSPYSDFEFGMLLGKLAAIRWIRGCEWNYLDQ
jgi:hypothetical protein